MSRWLKRLKMMRISKYAIVICLLLSIVFAGFTVYGANTGNFNILVQESDVSLAVYMKDDKSDLGEHLSAPTIDDMYDTTYNRLPQDIATRGTPEKGLGAKNDRYLSYLAFSVCIVNQSDRAVDFTAEMTVTDTGDGINGGKIIGAMRVALIEENDPLSAAKIYALPEANEENLAKLNSGLEEYGRYPSETIDFLSDMQIFNETYHDLGVGAERKFTIVIWLEGCDVECEDAIFGAKIKMRLDFIGI